MGQLAVAPELGETASLVHRTTHPLSARSTRAMPGSLVKPSRVLRGEEYPWLLATTTPRPSDASVLSVAPSPFSKTDCRQSAAPESRARKTTPSRPSTLVGDGHDAAVEQHRR